MTYVSRDVFARQEIHKTRERSAVCAECGVSDAPKIITGTNHLLGKVYRYRIESDGGRVSEDRHTFCSLTCRRAYYGE